VRVYHILIRIHYEKSSSYSLGLVRKAIAKTLSYRRHSLVMTLDVVPVSALFADTSKDFVCVLHAFNFIGISEWVHGLRSLIKVGYLLPEPVIYSMPNANHPSFRRWVAQAVITEAIRSASPRYLRIVLCIRCLLK